MFGSNIKGMKLNHFMTTLLLDPYFKIKGWIYKGILKISVKKLLNLILFPLISPNFGGMKIWDFKEIKRNEYSLPLKLPNNEMSFPFFPLKLSNKGKKEYSKIILFISFYFILFPPPKRCLIVWWIGRFVHINYCTTKN